MQKLSVLFEWGARLGILRLVNGPHLLEADELPADQKAALQAYFASPRFGAGIRAELRMTDLEPGRAEIARRRRRVRRLPARCPRA